VAPCPLYGISPLALAHFFHLPEAFCIRWKAQLRKDPERARAVARFIYRDLGAIDPTWAGWLCKDGLLWSPEGWAASPSQVLALPLMREQLREWERAQRWQRESSLENQQLAKIRSEVSELLLRAVEALRQR
jgi:hypothetical protein